MLTVCCEETQRYEDTCLPLGFTRTGGRSISPHEFSCLSTVTVKTKPL